MLPLSLLGKHCSWPKFRELLCRWRLMRIIHRVLKKRATIHLPLTLPNANRFQNSFTDRLSGKFLAKQLFKYPTAPYTRRYTTLWNVGAQKSQWSRAEWSELPRKTHPFKTAAQKYSSTILASSCSLTKRHLHWPHRKNTEWPTVRTSVNQKERHDKTLASTTFSHWYSVSRRVTSGWHYTSLTLVDHGVKLSEE